MIDNLLGLFIHYNEILFEARKISVDEFRANKILYERAYKELNNLLNK